MEKSFRRPKENQVKKDFGRSVVLSMFLNEEWREKTREEVVDRSFNKTKAVANSDFSNVLPLPQQASSIYKPKTKTNGIF